MTSRQEVDLALDEGRVEVMVRPNRWWKVRRNGKTYVPKRAPDGWYVPVKYGLYGYGRLDQSDFDNNRARIVK